MQSPSIAKSGKAASYKERNAISLWILYDPDAAADYGFNTPQARVTATAGGKDRVLVFGKDVEGSAGNCWLKIEGGPKVYQVKKAILDRFTRDFDFYRVSRPQPAKSNPRKRTDHPPSSLSQGDWGGFQVSL